LNHLAVLTFDRILAGAGMAVLSFSAMNGAEQSGEGMKSSARLFAPRQ
jgi:hypothetical protein